MILVDKSNIQNIPFLHLVKEEYIDKPLPTCFFIHGFTSAKEHNLHYAYLLAEKGFRVILPDCLEHGERATGKSEYQLGEVFWKIVLNTIHELSVLKAYFEEKGLILPSGIGVAGTSMGGIVTLGALTQYQWISSAVSLMGNPTYVKFAKAQLSQVESLGYDIPFSQEEIDSMMNELAQYDLSLQPDKLGGRPLMFWHGKRDKVVPFNLTREFYDSILPYYQKNEDHLLFIEDDKADHKVTREGVLKLVEWFEKHLSA
ncbi:prolyl oligopeptidase family serine peptidase [Rossellomorea aquimaris]|uniref:prolyl oligopeptidase family serine peptidase n=1 Tax=Rossellomorea aquimaris TaxID=189382 RepID=UPI001CD2C7B6|nr:prolyl oligopeptidase family serine peptidase [Rossellomorea aquimaris]MCA1059512.1 prolyl oligopeptidase family serine peptidase [Rossellomorea aquimaris]